MFGNPRDNMRVQLLGISAIAEVEYSLSVATGGVALPLTAGHYQQAEQEAGRDHFQERHRLLNSVIGDRLC